MQIDPIIENLLKEFKKQRDQIEGMVEEVEKMRSQVSLLFPETIDMRTRKFLEDKVKTMVGFYNILLDMRKEIGKSIKEELDVRRRLEDGDMDINDIEEMLDISEMAKTVEKFKQKKDHVQDKRMSKYKGLDELKEKGIEIPGLKELNEGGE